MELIAATSCEDISKEKETLTKLAVHQQHHMETEVVTTFF
jgi:hypothetical protein